MDEIRALEERVRALELGLQEQRSLNQEQQRSLARRVQRNRRNTETIGAAFLAFGGFIFVVLLGLRIETSSWSYQMPPKLLETALGAGGIGAIAKHYLDKQISDD